MAYIEDMNENEQQQVCPLCDHCRDPLWRDANGYWTDYRQSSDCNASDRGHEVNGSPS